MLQWEYKTVNVDPSLKTMFGTKKINSDEMFNELGAQGWELVSTLASSNSRSIGYQAIFKRPRTV